MPFHDWSNLSGWDGVHQVWIVELLYWVKERLPEGYRAYIGTTPSFAVGFPVEWRPDVAVLETPQAFHPSDPTGEAELEEPEQEFIVAAIEPTSALLVERGGHIVAAIELVSPRNKDRASAQAGYARDYTAYLLRGIHLLLIDVHRKPAGFSFADQIAKELQIDQPPCPAPFAVGYRVGEPAPRGGRFLATWRRPLTVGQPLPTMRLHLTVHDFVPIDLEYTYARAAHAAYLD